MKADIFNERNDHNSFMVALLPVPALPEGIKRAGYFTECAVIGVNDVDGNEHYGACSLTPDEKDVIGDALADKCAEMGKWYWCNLYS